MRILKYLLPFLIITIIIPCIVRANSSFTVQEQLTKLESSFGGRIGIYAINTANDEKIDYRADERFPMCSTAKVMVCAAILKSSMKNPDVLQQNIKYTKQDIMAWSPITAKHLTDGMTISELCAAAIDYSDNTAMNLLIKQVGGAQAVTAFARSIGDKKFRLDRDEPELNTAIPGDVRDTTTPESMATSLQKLAMSNILGISQSEQLQTWLKANTTGDTRIRAGVPKDWIVGDKTGTGAYGTNNDIAVIWPPNCPPIIIAVYTTQKQKNAVAKNEIIASITRIVISEFARTDECLK
jgi:beta-lactamase class A